MKLNDLYDETEDLRERLGMDRKVNGEMCLQSLKMGAKHCWTLICHLHN